MEAGNRGGAAAKAAKAGGGDDGERVRGCVCMPYML